MSEEIEIMYLNLKHLLDDICIFLKDEINKDNLSQESRKHADNLIRRSKVQLQKISYLPIETGYMDMQNKIFKESIKSDLTEYEVNVPPMDHCLCPYLEFPAKDISREEKCGYLSWKTKVIFGFEKMRKYYAGICGDWLLIYHNEKDSKPCFFFDLKKNKAEKIVGNKQTEDVTHYFCIINTETELMHQFMAKTHKDMLQWVAKINKFIDKTYQQQSRQSRRENSPKLTEKNSPSKLEPKPKTEEIIIPSDENEDDTYDVIIVENEVSKVTQTNVKEEEFTEEDEEVYIDIEYKPEPVLTRKVLPPPPPVELINRNKTPIKLQQTPLPPLPKEEKNSIQSQVSYDNPITDVVRTIPSEEENSFSESESEDDIYDEVSTLSPSQIEKLKPVVMPKPPLLTKPKIVVKITKPFPNCKNSTKEILKMAKESSFK